MTIVPPEQAPGWSPPPPELRSESLVSTFDAPNCSDGKNRIKIRLVSHIQTGAIVEFNITHQTFHRGKWRDIASADSCHDTDVHLHRYARSAETRIGNPEVLVPITRLSDVQRGYDAAYDVVVDNWAANRERWQHA